VKITYFIDIDFKVHIDGKLKTIVTWSKMTRGQMIKYIIKNRIDNPEELKNFSFNGYKFDHTLSSDKKYVFIKQD